MAHAVLHILVKHSHVLEFIYSYYIHLMFNDTDAGLYIDNSRTDTLHINSLLL